MSRAKYHLSWLLLIVLSVGVLPHARAETLTPIHIGVSTNSATWFPLYVAWKKGLFRDQGLELLPVYSLSGLFTLFLGIPAAIRVLRFYDDMTGLLPALGLNVGLTLSLPLLISLGLIW